MNRHRHRQTNSKAASRQTNEQYEHDLIVTSYPTTRKPPQSSQIAFFLASLSSASLLSLSLSSALLFFSFSLIARSNSLSSSVRRGARTPNAPAINRPATAVVFSGRLSRLRGASPPPAPLSPRLRPAAELELLRDGKSKGAKRVLRLMCRGAAARAAGSRLSLSSRRLLFLSPCPRRSRRPSCRRRAWIWACAGAFAARLGRA
jgi:hypothetical protein